MLHGIQCIQSGCFRTCCKKSTAVNRDAFGQASKNPLHSIMLQESTAFNHSAWNPLHSIGMHFTRLHVLHCCIMDYTAAIMLHIIHCIQSGCIGPHCVNRTEYNRDPLCHNAWSLLHCMTRHGIHCIQSGCIGPRCMVSTAYKRDPLHHNVWNVLH